MELETLQAAFDKARASGDFDRADKYAAAIVEMEQATQAESAPWNPTDDMSTGERFLAGVGKGMTDIGYGAGQMLGLVDQEDIQEKNRIDQALADTTAGSVGDVVGTAAAALPAAFVPGANSVLGASAIGAGLGALEPVAEGSAFLGKLKNTALGALMGAGGQKAGQVVGDKASDYAKEAIKRTRQRMAGNQMADDVANRGLDLGLTVNPTQANPSKLNQTLEGLSGKIKTQQQAAIHNQPVFNAIARRELGLPENTPLTGDAFDALRNRHGAAYEAVKKSDITVDADEMFMQELADLANKVGDVGADYEDLLNEGLLKTIQSYAKDTVSPESAVEAIKRLRFQAKTLAKSSSPDDVMEAKAKRSIADAIDKLVSRNLSSKGKGDLFDAYEQARVIIAKSYDIEDVVNPGSGNVIGTKLAKKLGKSPLTGDLEDAAKFASQFDRASQEIKSSMPAFSPLDFAFGGGASVASGNPALMAMMLARPLARSAITSKPYQQMFGRPSYSNSLATKGAGLLGKAAPMGAGIAAPSIYTSQ